MNKYFIYCRKSSEQEDRQVLSLDSQEAELLKLARENKLQVVGVYKESGSAHVIGRKLFNEMLVRIEKGEANGLIVWDESRIARNSFEGGRVVYMMDLEQIIEIHKPGKFYKNTPDDKSWLTMCFMMSKKESDEKGVNVKRGLMTKAEKGWLPSGCKPGYMNDKYAEKGNKTLPIDPVRFPLIKQAWGLMLTGAYTPPQILRKLNNEWGYRSAIQKKQGGKPMSRSKIYQIFTDPFYYGEFEYPLGSGIWHKGLHTPIITREQFDRVQILLGKKGKPRPQVHEFFATGLIRCGECGCMITAEEKLQVICSSCKTKFASRNRVACPKCKTLIEHMEKPKLLRYVYYHCTKKKDPNCSQGWLQEKVLEKQIEDILSKVQISERFKDWAIKHLNEVHDNEVDTRNASLTALQEAYSNITKRIDNLVKLKISPQNTDGNLLSDEEFKEQKETLMKEKEEIKEQLGGIDSQVNKWVELSEKTFKFACYAKYWFAKGDLVTKRQILSGLGSNLKLKDKLFLPDVQNPLSFISEVKEEDQTISPEFEPKEKIDISSYMETLWSQKVTMLPIPSYNINIEKIIHEFTLFQQSYSTLSLSN